MRLRDAVKFSEVVFKLETADEKRFWYAPKEARDALMFANAESNVVIADDAPEAVVKFNDDKPAPTVVVAATTWPDAPIIAAVACVPPKVMPAELVEDQETDPYTSLFAVTPVPLEVPEVIVMLRPSAAVRV